MGLGDVRLHQDQRTIKDSKRQPANVRKLETRQILPQPTVFRRNSKTKGSESSDPLQDLFLQLHKPRPGVLIQNWAHDHVNVRSGNREWLLHCWGALRVAENALRSVRGKCWFPPGAVVDRDSRTNVWRVSDLGCGQSYQSSSTPQDHSPASGHRGPSVQQIQREKFLLWKSACHNHKSQRQQLFCSFHWWKHRGHSQKGNW